MRTWWRKLRARFLRGRLLDQPVRLLIPGTYQSYAIARVVGVSPVVHNYLVELRYSMPDATRPLGFRRCTLHVNHQQLRWNDDERMLELEYRDEG